MKPVIELFQRTLIFLPFLGMSFQLYARLEARLANGLDFYGIIPDTIFYTLFIVTGILLLVRSRMKHLSFSQKAVVFILATVGLRIAFWLTANQNEFPTGEVYYAVVPALNHPYQYPWQAPYGVMWYAITEFATKGAMLFVSPIMHLLYPICTCTANILYLDGHSVAQAYSYGDWVLGVSMMTGYTIISLPFYWFLRKSTLLVAFFIADNFFWATTPVNVPILLLATMGFFAKKYIPWAVIAKLPFGAPLTIWQFAFTSAGSIGHWFPHVMYGLFWVASILRWTKWKYAWNFYPNSREIELLNSQKQRVIQIAQTASHHESG